MSLPRLDQIDLDVTRADSYWTLDAPRWVDFPPLVGDHRVDVAIIGGGFTGLACAYYLRQFAPNQRVAVIEAQRFGSGGSSRNSGAFGPRYVGWRRRAAAGLEALRHYLALGQRGYDRLLAFIDEAKIACDIEPAKALYLPTTAADAAALEPQMAVWRETGLRAGWLDATALARAINTNWYVGAGWSAGFSLLHPGKLVAGLVQAAHGSGVELHEQTPVIELDTGRPARLRTPTGVITATNVVLATNAFRPPSDVAASAMTPAHHVVLISRPLSESEADAAGLVAWPCRFERGGWSGTMRLTPDRRVLMRGEFARANEVSLAASDLRRHLDNTRADFAARFPWVNDLAIDGYWYGSTARTADERMFFGPLDTDHTHLLVSVGCNGTGIMPCHYNGYLLACHLAGDTLDDFTTLYHDRPAITR